MLKEKFKIKVEENPYILQLEIIKFGQLLFQVSVREYVHGNLIILHTYSDHNPC